MTTEGPPYPREGHHIPKGEASYTNMGASYIYRGAFSAYRGASNTHRGPTIPTGASYAKRGLPDLRGATYTYSGTSYIYRGLS